MGKRWDGGWTDISEHLEEIYMDRWNVVKPQEGVTVEMLELVCKDIEIRVLPPFCYNYIVPPLEDRKENYCTPPPRNM